jgi:hypothetical protein
MFCTCGGRAAVKLLQKLPRLFKLREEQGGGRLRLYCASRHLPFSHAHIAAPHPLIPKTPVHLIFVLAEVD